MLTKANWDNYFGNNNNKITKPDIFAFGSVHFGKHLGKPLTQELCVLLSEGNGTPVRMPEALRTWEDIIHRLCATGICIYRYDSARWCCGRSEGHVIISLDENDDVKDIEFTPYLQMRKNG